MHAHINFFPFKFLPLICAFLTLALKQASPQIQRKPENQLIEIVGTVRLVHGLGPPGYGETPRRDAKVTYWAIQTGNRVIASPNTGEFDCIPTRQMKLFFPGLELPLMSLPAASWKNQQVVIKGKIHCADTAGEMTSIYMDVDHIGPPHK